MSARLRFGGSSGGVENGSVASKGRERGLGGQAVLAGDLRPQSLAGERRGRVRLGGEGARRQIALGQCEFAQALGAVLEVVRQAGGLLSGEELQRVEDGLFGPGVARAGPRVGCAGAHG